MINKKIIKGTIKKKLIKEIVETCSRIKELIIIRQNKK